MWALLCVLAALVMVFLAVIAHSGIHQVPVGAVGVVFSSGRRTTQTRPEGYTWLLPFLQRMEIFYTSPRQISVPQHTYITAEQVQLRLRVTVSLFVSDALKLLDRGPGLYAPFQRPPRGEVEAGSRERLAQLNDLVFDAVRASVQTVDFNEVVNADDLTRAVEARLSPRCESWGLRVEHVLLPEVDPGELGKAREAARIIAEKSTVFLRAATEMAAQWRRATGESLPVNQLVQYLAGQYRDLQELEIAGRVRGAGFLTEIVQRFHDPGRGRQLPPVPVPVLPPCGVQGGSGDRTTIEAPCASCGSVSSSSARYCDGCGFELRPAAAPRSAAGRGPWVVGREPSEVHIFLDGDGISRRHAQIEARGSTISIVDLNSNNGTFVGGRRLRPNVPVDVQMGDRIGFGVDVVITVADLLARVGARHGAT